MHIDFKISTWERAQVPEGMEDKVLQACKEGKINTVNELNDFVKELDNTDEFIDWETLEDVVEYLTLEDNGYDATIEVFDENVNRTSSGPIWTNAE